MERKDWIENKCKELKKAGMGGLALIHVRHALQDAWEAGMEFQKSTNH